MKGKGLVREQTGRIVIGPAEHSGSHPFGLAGSAARLRRGRSGGSQRIDHVEQLRSTVTIGEAGGPDWGVLKRSFFVTDGMDTPFLSWR